MGMNTKSKKIFIGLVGEFACGKGTIAKYIAKKYKGKIVTFSDPLNDILFRIGEKKIRDNQSALANGLRKAFGEDILSRALMQEASLSKNKIIIIDGFRKMGELKYFKQFDNFVLINIKVDIKTRYERIIKRGEKVDEKTKTFEGFKKDHKLAADTDILKVAKEADYQVDNTGYIKDTYGQIDSIIQIILK